jgi:transcriptional regulator with XRE-family HTH domain
MTTLGSIIEERHITYAALAARAQLQPRTVRAIATGETPLDRVSVGTIRRIAAALAIPVAVILEVDDPVHPGDAGQTRTARLSAAVREVMWPRGATPYPYPSPVEAGGRDEIADLTADEFFSGMPPIDARRG